ncbi:phytanoyl-CoA dioxygenase domain-containing protein 1-like isoform X1 [Tachypleus tridentatus]|uniref:phytanoyl-CoA dioxygenase domain-containing protein 1-like isoform X1 n=1 Tax=Tachypleus tridentatus TaxID=6853 RepID=UPI003FD0B923
MVSSEEIDRFREDGYVILHNFLSEEEIESMKEECKNLVEKLIPSEQHDTFSTEPDQHFKRNEYFLTSGDKVRYFFEDDALNSKGELIMPKNKCLNKIGHALHWWCPAFKKITFSRKVRDVISSLGYEEPIVVQSMYIFKHPEIGSVVVPHQDSTFLHTSPPTAVGLWFPLEDVTIDNGCLWFIPGSHKGPLYCRFKRNPEKEGPLLFLEGKIEFEESQFVPCPVKKGSCVVIHGLVIHKSGKNITSNSRPAYTFHVVEQKNTTYSSENWLQPTPELPFPSLNTSA